MQQVAVSEVDQAGAVVPSRVLQALGAVPGDVVAFIENDDGSISLSKAASVQPQGTVMTPDLSVALSVGHGLVQLYPTRRARPRTAKGAERVLTGDTRHT